MFLIGCVAGISFTAAAAVAVFVWWINWTWRNSR